MVHPHILIFVPILIVKAKKLFILRIVNIGIISTAEFENGFCFPILKSINREVTVVILIGIDDIAFLVKSVNGIFLIVPLRPEYRVDFLFILRFGC